MTEQSAHTPQMDAELSMIDAMTDHDILNSIGDDLPGMVGELSEYERYTVLASASDVSMTPALMLKWAAFADAVSKDRAPAKVIMGHNNSIAVERPYTGQVATVIRNRRNALKREARQAAKDRGEYDGSVYG